MAGQIDREASYRRAIEVYAGAAEDPRCAAASLLAGWTRLQLGDGAARTLLEEAAVLAPEHDVAPRLLEMTPDALSQTVLVFQEDGLCPTLRPLRFNIHTWQTGWHGWLCPSRCFVILKRLAPLSVVQEKPCQS